MEPTEIYAALQAKFGDAVAPSDTALAGDPFAWIAPERLHDALKHLKEDPSLQFDQLTLVTGVDRGEWIEAVYHLYSYPHQHWCVVKAKLDREAPEVDSVTDLWGAADWHERETWDMLGIRFRNHPDLKRILLPEDWEGHPLRRDYKEPLEYHGIKNDLSAGPAGGEYAAER